jgi:hypothetical protein
MKISSTGIGLSSSQHEHDAPHRAEYHSPSEKQVRRDHLA